MRLERALRASKSLCRTGWMLRGVPGAEAETVAEHSFEAAVLAYFLAEKLAMSGVRVDAERATAVALFHDMGESVMGDLVKWTGKRVDKPSVEREAFRELKVGEELFAEYSSRRSLESRLAKLSDVLSTHLQALRYAQRGYDVSEIVEATSSELQELLSDPELAPLKKEVQSLTNLKSGDPDPQT
ncbi:phosphohydrolase [Sulfodiicoccus acidiphilus]|uniref:5'-deoxynucleotidase n=1 Tax=Sulfodiicoccus acidiphilus TaxID=1670455 RepID=A0A348B4F3_9CREN|nr:HD family hydrolase [Sulfodiicoccus acidiphilus]BBD73055.1 phosphohydrolase [Sulfodiicoccus acidiphilus]GGU03934.1 phosphohydrolase [Sulfodiicoccus acidiphilus]